MFRMLAAPLGVVSALLLGACAETGGDVGGQNSACPYDLVQGPTQGLSEQEISNAANVTREACGLAVSYFSKQMGISAATLASYDIYFLNQTQNVGSGCCFAERSGGRVKIFTDIDHELWAQNLPWLFDRGRAVYWHQIRNGIHEYTHAVQIKLGAIQTSSGNHIPRWFEEGMAEFVAFDAIIRRGAVGRQQAYQFQLSAAIDSNEMNRPLRAYAPSNSPAWPGHVGMIVVAGLLDHSKKGPDSLIEYTRLAGQYRSHDRALQQVYGLSAAEMYEMVENWRQRVGTNENAQPLWSR